MLIRPVHSARSNSRVLGPRRCLPRSIKPRKTRSDPVALPEQRPVHHPRRVTLVEMGATREIARSAEDVFEFLSDASNNPLWQAGMRSCEWTSDPPIGIDSTYEQHARFMGRDVRSTFVVTEYEKGRRIVIRAVESTFPIEVERSVTSTGTSSCRASAVISGGPEARLARVFEPLVTKMAQRSVDKDYDRLVALLER